MKEKSLTLTVSQAAAALGISRNLAYEAARDGRIPALRIGRRLLVSRRALERLLEDPQSNILPMGKQTGRRHEQ